jgi:ribulose-bisphosphate carboxylase small chain
MRLETFSYLPEFTREQTEAQIDSILRRGLVVAVEHSPRVDPRNHYWTLWQLPLFDVHEPEVVLDAIRRCRRAHPHDYVRVNGYDAHRQGQVVSFVVHRPLELSMRSP